MHGGDIAAAAGVREAQPHEGQDALGGEVAQGGLRGAQRGEEDLRGAAERTLAAAGSEDSGPPLPGRPGTHLCHLLWVLRRFAEDLLEVALVLGEKVSGLGICTVQRRVEAVLDFSLEGGAHRAALDEAHTGDRERWVGWEPVRTEPNLAPSPSPRHRQERG